MPGQTEFCPFHPLVLTLGRKMAKTFPGLHGGPAEAVSRSGPLPPDHHPHPRFDPHSLPILAGVFLNIQAGVAARPPVLHGQCRRDNFAATSFWTLCLMGPAPGPATPSLSRCLGTLGTRGRTPSSLGWRPPRMWAGLLFAVSPKHSSPQCT